jgi:P27 family predicted phage terminase small subunit
MVDWDFRRYRQCAELIAKEGVTVETGAGGSKRHPAWDIQKQAYSQWARTAKLMGLTVSTEASDVGDELDELLGG